MIVSFDQKHSICLISQAQRGFLFFLMVDQGLCDALMQLLMEVGDDEVMR